MNDLAHTLSKSLDMQKLNRYLPMLFNILFILASAYTLSQLTWLLVPSPSHSQAPTPTRHSPSAQGLSAEQEKIRQIPQAHLFGIYQSQSVAPVQTDAPETKLNLVLKGLLAASPMTHASAIIALGKNGKEDIYGIGDRVSSATVKEIHTDRVILERNGRFETLRLPKEFSQNTLIETSSRNNLPPSTPGEMLSDIRQKILKNPTSFGDYAIPIPYNQNGKLRGYRLQPQGDSTLFNQLGLDPKDVIIKLNGIDLNNPNNGLQAIRKLQNAKQVDITVLRNGAEIPLHFEIP